MKLHEFKAGDVIHRTEPIETPDSGLSMWTWGQSGGTRKDYSYIQSAIEVVDMKSGLLFYRDRITFLGKLEMNAKLETLPISRWDDDHWDFYPLEHLPAPTLPTTTPEPPIKKANNPTGDEIERVF